MIKIPKEAFKTQAEDGSDVLPEVGDEIPFSGFTGMVKADKGDSLVIELTSFNGQPVTYEEGEEPAPPSEDQVKDDLLERMEKGEE